MKTLEDLKVECEDRHDISCEEGESSEIGFEHHGMWIENPWLSCCGRFEVNPTEEYGEAFKEFARSQGVNI